MQGLAWLHALAWGPWTQALLLFTGVYLTFALRFIQVRRLPMAVSCLLHSPKAGGDIPPFQALTTVLAATVGTGSLAGVATAVALGGPGALLWMWLTAVFGMATKYSEAVLAVRYRTRTAHGYVGGPMYYMVRGLGPGARPAAVCFSVSGALAAFGIGNMVQANTVARALGGALSVPVALTGSVLTVLTGLVIFGGLKRIGTVTSLLVPLMAAVYIAGCLAALVRFSDRLPMALWQIIQGAFSGTAARGGFAGAALDRVIQTGLSRGIFVNEAGLGSAPIAHAAAMTASPARQGLVAMSGTLFDTLLVSGLTGLVIVSSGVWTTGLSGAELTALTFQVALGPLGALVVLISVVLFASSTIVGWSYYGEKCMEFLFGHAAVTPYRALWTAAVCFGSLLPVGTVWSASDVMNGFMAIPNLVAVLLLSPIVVCETRKEVL
ncbi:MAG: alanine/glycine:cation symporter family protein [Bacillota bacterium]